MNDWRVPAEKYTLARMLETGTTQWPDRIAMEFGSERITYAEMWERSVAVANSLHRLGIGARDAVAIHSHNCPEYLYAYFGASLLGAITVPINFHHRGTFLEHQLNVADSKVLIAAESRLDRLAPIIANLPALEHVFAHGADGASAVSELAGVKTGLTEELVVEGGSEPIFSHVPEWSDPNIVLFTGGTTGPSKAGLASNHYVLAASVMTYLQKQASPDDIFWSPLPLCHGNALMQTVLGPMYHGARGSLDERFSVSGFWSRVRTVGATQVSILGAQFTMLWSAPARPDDADNPVVCMYGAPMPVEIHHAFQERFGVRYITGYGLGEAFPLLLSYYDDPPPPGTCGRAWDRYDVRIFDDEDREVEDGVVGEFVARPREPHVMFEGYLKNPTATLGVFGNLWHHTGDYGRRRPDGWFEFVDRKRDYMRRRGENVSSWEVEQAALLHPDVVEVAAYSVPSEVTEDDIMIMVRLAPGASLSHLQLAEHCAANMPYFAVPRYIEFTDSQLSNDLGKIQKHALQARGVGEKTWDAEAVGYRPAR